MAYFHGVYNTEQDTSLTVPIQGSAGLQRIRVAAQESEH